LTKIIKEKTSDSKNVPENKKSSSPTKQTSRDNVIQAAKSPDHVTLSKRAASLARRTSKNTGRHTVAIKLKTSSRSSKKVEKKNKKSKANI